MLSNFKRAAVVMVLCFGFSKILMAAGWVPSSTTTTQISKVSYGQDFNNQTAYIYFLQISSGAIYILPNKEMAAIAMAKVANSQDVRLLTSAGSWTISGMGTFNEKVDLIY